MFFLFPTPGTQSTIENTVTRRSLKEGRTLLCHRDLMRGAAFLKGRRKEKERQADFILVI